MKNSEKLLDKIQSENVQQKKRIEFTARNVFFWALFSVGILIGGIAFSVILFAISQTDFDILEHITHSKIEFFLGLLPVLWIVFAVLFLGISIWGIKATKRGYKYHPLLVFAGSVVCSVVLGIVFYYSGGGQKIENIFAKNVPGYQSVEDKKLATWSMPSEGFLSGKIVSVNGSEILLQDWDGKEWKVDTSSATIRGRVSVSEGEEIKMIGTIQSDNAFAATEIRPWNGAGNNGKNR